MVFSVLVFVSLVKFISRYLILDAIANGSVFTISFANFVYCQCTETADFYVLTLCPAGLLNSFLSANIFLVGSLRLSYI